MDPGQLQTAKRLFPPEFDAEEEKRFILAAAKAAGVAVDVKADPRGEPVRHDDRRVLCLSHISGLEIAAPSGLRDRTTLYAAELPWDRGT